ncbi:MAG: hypothetical protein JNK02_07445 [Planctomycetes bacterium]|nr:hypothetical protein [Planctomycetota bacterium]
MSPKRPGSKLALLAIYVAAAWLVAWAGLKLFVGNPQSLPASVRDTSPFGPELTFRLAIAIELSIFCLALVRPRWGWPPLAALYAVFVAVLVPLVAAGAKSCGCGGGAITMPPLLMLSIDAALLVAVLATRPWQSVASPRLPAALLVAGLALSWAAPWALIRSSSSTAGPIVVDAETGQVRAGSKAIRYAFLDPDSWKGRPIVDVPELTQWIGAETLPVEGSIVFWRQSCPDCAAHLRKMAAEDAGGRQILLVQARDDLKSERMVDALPEGGHVTHFAFPEHLECAFTTPCEVVIEAGNVAAVLYQKDFAAAGH